MVGLRIGSRDYDCCALFSEPKSRVPELQIFVEIFSQYDDFAIRQMFLHSFTTLFCQKRWSDAVLPSD